MDDDFLKNITILIVENNLDDLNSIQDTLEKYFKNIIVAKDGQEALNTYLANRNIDIIIASYDLPKMNGVTFLKSLRELDLYIPFIMVSDRSDREFFLEIINLNVSSYISKPIDVKSILEKVDILCEKKLFEYKLQQKQAELDKYISSVNSVAIIYKMDSSGKITYMNNSMFEISGYTKEDVEDGIDFNTIIHPDVPNKYIGETLDYLDTGKTWKGNTKFISKEGETFYLNCTVFTLDSKNIEYITVAFSTTKENLEKRDFHKKVLNGMKEANLKAYRYQKEAEELRFELDMMANRDSGYRTLKNRISSLRVQIENYEKEILASRSKFDKMLQAKKNELERYINIIQEEKIKNEKIQEENDHLKKEYNIMFEKFDRMKDDNIKMLQRIKDLREALSEAREKTKN